MSRFDKIIRLVKEAFELAIKQNIPNLLQPGLVKEMIIAETLNHELITTKKRSRCENSHCSSDYPNPPLCELML